jgi:hypothetical protein
MKYDVIVCGAGSSGMVAAISASRQGLKTLLVEKSATVGGTNVNSLVGPFMTFHAGDKQIVNGIAQEIVDRLKKENACLGHIADPIGFCSTITPFEPENLKNLYFEYLDEENIDLLLNATVVKSNVDNNKISSIEVVSKTTTYTFEADIFIDATGDADLSYLSGVDFTMGRTEDNLCQPMSLMLIMKNVDMNKIRDYINKYPEDFELDKTYTGEYVACSGFFSKVKEAQKNNEFNISRDRVLMFEHTQKDEALINMTRVTMFNGCDPLQLSKAEIAVRKQIKPIVHFLKKYIPGFENSYLKVSANQIGVRESRHIKGLYTLQESDIVNRTKFEDSICLGAFPIDIHSPTGTEMKFVHLPKDNNYQIPYRTLITEKVDNLLVCGRCISATHEAAASLRVTPTVMAMGEACGVAAKLALNSNNNVKNINIKELQDILVKQNQIIE